MSELWRSRVQLLVLIGVFVVPLLVATWLYLSGAYEGVIAPAASNHGELMSPVLPLPSMSVVINEQTVDLLDEVRGHWVYLQVLDGACDLDCQANVFKSRQVRASLNQNVERVERFFLLMPAADVAALRDENPDAVWVQLGELPPELLDVLDQPGSENVYLLDPYGNVVLRYGSQHTSRGWFKDIKKLLKISQIG